MRVTEVAIVGSGAAGMAAALGLTRRGVRPLVLDVGYRVEAVPPVATGLYAHRDARDSYDLLVGSGPHAWRNQLANADAQMPAKLLAPAFGFVLRGAEEIGPITATGFVPTQSFAAGGLANAWGAGLYRMNDRDLAGMPLAARDLDPYYDELSDEIGLCGANDDLSPYFGSTRGLAPPLRLSRNAARLLESYTRRRDAWHRRRLYLGRPRLGVLSEAYRGRTACDYANLEFWLPGLPHVYSPLQTLEALRARDAIDYRAGLVVETVEELRGSVRICARELSSGNGVRFEARRVLLAAGPLNSARILLRSRNDLRTELEVLDNPAVQVPLVLPRAVGDGLERDCFGLTQLNVVYDSPDGELYQASLLETTSPARAEFFSRFPISARSSFRFLRDFLPAILVMQLFYPLRAGQGGRLKLAPGGRLEVRGPSLPRPPHVLPTLLRALAGLGAFGFARLGATPALGGSNHLAGTLPMRAAPRGAYECDSNGALAGSERLFVVDGSLLSHVPAKNSTFTVMALAMRIADRLGARIREANA